ncbi:MAG: nucleoside triphosphate pyrophosphohydrolase [Lentisphaerae bacterium]|jgi:tetrapyrrole methylase family protein / MazG family protein|nr:nucleoside triphosphate pyrophosphohydrolase [Lentisphaerota bacterium]MBT5611890.1 nucleoside triphosphate pyrophosphohydrolase [Lentisphaerota bacterium]MBT7055513.1 nucleoside triphosphate pyrophosphohydrolase [Lentisphaerota bacterium]MBT7847507.1 nucleoside triphosphate pyrophosphohydrolase [Lentisphaerota bacterium]
MTDRQDTPVDSVAELVDILTALRAPGGCPWDREQTHETLKYYLVEESGELLDAIDERNDPAMMDELGDVLLQIVFHAQIASERGAFSLEDVARACCDKMIRRHPHVFGHADVDGADGVIRQWEEIKRLEKGDAAPDSAVAGVPRHLPALHRAHKIQKKAAKVGFEWATIDGAIAKIEEELAEVKDALQNRDDSEVAEEIGDLLFAVVNLSRFRQHYAEDLLHQTVRKFERRFRHMEDALGTAGRELEQCSLDELSDAWDSAKVSLREGTAKIQPT